MRDRITNIELRLRREEQWLPIDTPETAPQAMFDAYLRARRLSCCTLQGGFFIDVGNRTWSDDSTSDEFHMTQIWFEAMTALLRGDDSFGPGYGPWEESSLTWSRVGDDVTMVDSRGGDMMWSVTVDLPSLALHVADRGRAFARWSRETRTLARTALTTPTTAEAAAIVEANLPTDRDLATIDQLVDRMLL